MLIRYVFKILAKGRFLFYLKSAFKISKKLLLYTRKLFSWESFFMEI